MLTGKTWLDYTHLFSPNDYKKNDKKNTLRLNMVEEAILEFRLKKIDQTRNYFLE